MSFGSDRQFIHAALAATLWVVLLPITSAAAQVTATCGGDVVRFSGRAGTTHFNVRCKNLGYQEEVKANGTTQCKEGSVQSCERDWKGDSHCSYWTGFDLSSDGTCYGISWGPDLRQMFCELYAYRAKAQVERNFAGACNFTGPAWDAAFADHVNWCMHLSPAVYESATQNEESNRENALQQCKAPSVPPPGFGTASPSVSADECQGYANTAVGQYRQYVALHCGPTNDLWFDDLKAHFGWCMGHSAADWQTAQFARTRVLQQCRERPPIDNLPASGIDPRVLRCPSGTVLVGGTCITQRPGGGVSPSKGIPGSGKVEPIPTRNVCPPDQPVGAWPNCCPSGTSFVGGACVRPGGGASPSKDVPGSGTVPKPSTSLPSMPLPTQQPGGGGSSPSKDIPGSGKADSVPKPSTPLPKQQTPAGGSSPSKDTGSGKTESVPKPRTSLPKQQKVEDRAVPKPTIPPGALLKCPTGQQRNSKGQCEQVFRAPR